MKHVASFLVLLTLLSVAAAQDTPKNKPIVHARDLARSEIIGFLDSPMGRVVEIDAVIVSGESTRMKRYVGQYLLRVESVAGKRMETPRNFEFMVPAHLDAGVANDNFSLYEMKHSKPAKSLNSDEIAILERGYVGSRVKLAAYEVGGFGGLPENLPRDVGSWSSPYFHFSTYLVVLKQVADTKKEAELSDAPKAQASRFDNGNPTSGPR